MRRHRGFTLVELLVVVAVIALLIAILLPSLAKARVRARTTICLTNQRHLVVTYRQYYSDMGTVLSSTGHGNSGAWDYQLLAAYRDLTPTQYYTNNGFRSDLDKVRWCPETAPGRRGDLSQFGTPAWSRSTSLGTTVLAWDCHHGPGGGSTGSYAMNNWMYNATGYVLMGSTTPPPAGDFWRIKNTNQEFAIPVFVDSIWHDMLPKPTDLPVQVYVPDPESGAMRNLSDACMNRHDKAENVAFWDGHAETVKLRELWAVKWSARWVAPNPLPFVLQNPTQ